MSAKNITALILLSCLVVWGMPATRITHYEAGIALAQDADTDGQRLIRELEEALKSNDQERIRQAQQRVNAHKQAAYILSQRPALQLQLKTAMSQPQAAAVKSQTTLSQTQQKQAAPLQTKTLERFGGLSSATQLQGASRSESLALSSTQSQGMAKEGMAGRLQGASQEPIGTGMQAIQGVSREIGGVSRETAVGVSSAGIQGTASDEISRGTGSLERPAGISREGVKGLGTATSVGSGTAAPDALGSSPPVAAQVKVPPPETPAPVRRAAPAPKPPPAAAPAPPAPVAAVKPVAPATTPAAPPGFVPPATVFF